MLSHVQLFAAPWTAVLQAPLSMGFSGKNTWSGLPLPTPGDLPDPGIKPLSLVSPELAGGFFTTVPPGKPRCYIVHITIPLPHYSYISLISYVIYKFFFIFYR